MITTIRVILAVCLLVQHPALALKQTSRSESQTSDAHLSAPKRVGQFTLTQMSNGTTTEGAPFSQNTFERLPGEKVFVIIIHFPSAESVAKQFETKLGAASAVIERNKLTTSSQVNEERAVIQQKRDDNKTLTTILTTAGKELREIQSFSMPAALDFERQSREAAPR